MIRHEKAAYIAAMKEIMDDMAREEEQLQSMQKLLLRRNQFCQEMSCQDVIHFCFCVHIYAVGLEVKLASAKQEIEERSKVMTEKQRELISRQLVETLDKDSLAEMSDNVWLRKEIRGEQV